jgi:putative hemolysin
MKCNGPHGVEMRREELDIAEFQKGHYVARLARTDEDVHAALHLRHLAFFDADADPDEIETDEYDNRCEHMLVQDTRTGEFLCSYRLMIFGSGAEIDRSYSAQFYDLGALHEFTGPMVEIGRFCIRPGITDPNLLRVAWAALTRIVDQRGIEMMFGCSSFPGTRPDDYTETFALLTEKHIAPRRWLPKVKAPKVFRFADRLLRVKFDRRTALRRMPPLLKTYLTMGGWVSDHAVIDPHMNTLHVFTGVELRRIPAGRAQLLRATAQ